MLRFRSSLLALTCLGLVAAAIPASGGTTTEGFHVVRFSSAITDASREALSSTGARILDYEPDDAYLVWATPAQRSAASGLASVASVDELAPSRKLQPELADARGPTLTEVTLYGPARDDVLPALRRLGTVGLIAPSRSDGLLLTTTAMLRAAAIPAAAGLPGVLYVSRGSSGLFAEDEMGDQIMAGNIGTNNRATTGYSSWLTQKNLDGTGVTVAVVDTGVDEHHPDLLLRVDKPRDYTSPAEPVDTLGHGTHVAGIIAGAPPAGILPRDPDGFVYGQGMAPKARLLDLNAIGVGGTLNQFDHGANIDVIANDAWDAGAKIWNASWHTGEGNRVGYTASTRTTDEIVRNADFEAPGSEEFLPVFSAGNAGTSGPTVPHEAKNIIAVGATNSGRGLAYPLTGNIDTIASFSSRGPAKDGRVFPTVSAPGENVVSARATVGAITAACVAPPDGAGLYATCSGTSMAAPHTAGAAALIHQWWARDKGRAPSPAMVRAQVVNTATDMGSKDIPNNNEGWGRVNLGKLFGDQAAIASDQETVFGELGESASRTVTSSGGTPLKVTVAWSDAPASVGATKTLVNDLDLRVELLGAEGQVLTTWLGNVFQSGASKTGGVADRKNNLENVYLNAPQAGTYRITISAANLPGDGIPENADDTDQDFALVVRGATAV